MTDELYGQTGLIDTGVDGSRGVPFGQSRNGAMMTAQTRGKYYESTARGKCFYACNIATQAVSVALNTTYTGLALANNVGSGKMLSLLRVGIGLTAAPAGIASLGLIGGYSATANITHTTPLAPAPLLLGSSAAAVGKADSAATISTPLWIASLQTGFTAGALFSTTPNLIDIDGGIVLLPGAFVAIGALTAVTGYFSMFWEEIPL